MAFDFSKLHKRRGYGDFDERPLALLANTGAYAVNLDVYRTNCATEDFIDRLDDAARRGNKPPIIAAAFPGVHHAATRAYLRDEAPSLTLHAPAAFAGGRFTETDEPNCAGKLMNEVHREFSNHTGIDTLREIEIAMAKGARMEVHNDFRSAQMALGKSASQLLVYDVRSSADASAPEAGNLLEIWKESGADRKIIADYSKIEANAAREEQQKSTSQSVTISCTLNESNPVYISGCREFSLRLTDKQGNPVRAMIRDNKDGARDRGRIFESEFAFIAEAARRKPGVEWGYPHMDTIMPIELKGEWAMRRWKDANNQWRSSRELDVTSWRFGEPRAKKEHRPASIQDER